MPSAFGFSEIWSGEVGHPGVSVMYYYFVRLYRSFVLAAGVLVAFLLFCSPLNLRTLCLVFKKLASFTIYFSPFEDALKFARIFCSGPIRVCCVFLASENRRACKK